MNSGLSSKNKGIRHRTNGPRSCRPREAWVFAPFGAITQSSAALNAQICTTSLQEIAVSETPLAFFFFRLSQVENVRFLSVFKCR